jgi:hypothetical protein
MDNEGRCSGMHFLSIQPANDPSLGGNIKAALLQHAADKKGRKLEIEKEGTKKETKKSLLCTVHG